MNVVLIDDKLVTGVEQRNNIMLLVAPVGGFPDTGAISGEWKSPHWSEMIGQSILEPNRQLFDSYNKMNSFMMQILRDTAQPRWQEFSQTPKARPEEIIKRGAVFHYNAGEAGLQAVQPPVIPLELRAALIDMNAEIQKGAFSDPLYGLLGGGGMPGYTLSQISESANRLLAPYQEAKHFVLGEIGTFWLATLKNSKKTLDIRGKTLEKLKPSDIPDNVYVTVTSDLAAAKDWLERGTVAGMLKGLLDRTTILDTILKIPDTEKVRSRMVDDLVLEHPIAQNLQLALSFRRYADFLKEVGDSKQAQVFLRAADMIEGQIGGQPQGGGQPPQAGGQYQQVAKPPPQVMPPEERGSPEERRQMLGSGEEV